MTAPVKIPAKGTFLLSNPFLADPNFRRSVVLLTEHDEDGSVGFILNKPTNLTLMEAIPDFPDFEGNLYLGGPVQPETLHFLHVIDALSHGAESVRDGVYWGGNYDLLREMISRGEVHPDQIRFFMGYSGWGARQLDGEMKAKSWIVSKATRDFTFTADPQNLWKDVLCSMGRKYQLMSNYPLDPSLN